MPLKRGLIQEFAATRGLPCVGNGLFCVMRPFPKLPLHGCSLSQHPVRRFRPRLAQAASPRPEKEAPRNPRRTGCAPTVGEAPETRLIGAQTGPAGLSQGARPLLTISMAGRNRTGPNLLQSRMFWTPRRAGGSHPGFRTSADGNATGLACPRELPAPHGRPCGTAAGFQLQTGGCPVEANTLFHREPAGSTCFLPDTASGIGTWVNTPFQIPTTTFVLPAIPA